MLDLASYLLEFLFHLTFHAQIAERHIFTNIIVHATIQIADTTPRENFFSLPYCQTPA